MIAIFANNPFDDEIRIDCELIKTKTEKDGNICILPDFNKSIFDIKDVIVECIKGNNIRKIKISGVGIVKFESNQFNCFGSFKEVI